MARRKRTKKQQEATTKKSSAVARRDAGATTPPKIIEERWSGPLPPPGVVERYERLHPGAANVVFDAFDEQTKHRRELEKQVVGGSEERANRGQFIAGALLVLGIALAADPWAGGGVVVFVLASGAAVYFAGGRPPPRQEDDSD